MCSIFSWFVLGGALIVAVHAFINAPTAYDFLFLLPMAYFVTYFFGQRFAPKWITYKIVMFTAFLRYVLLPCLISYEPNYRVGSYICTSPDAINSAILYQCYELVFIFVFFCILGAKKKSFSYTVLPLKSSNFAIKTYLALSAIVLILNPSVFEHVNFFRLDASTGQRVGEEEISTSLYILRQLLVTSVLLAFVLFSTYFCRFYKSSGNRKYIYMNIILAIFCISMIIGEQRSNQVYTAFATIFVMRGIYPDEKKKITTILLGAAFLVLAMLSIYKTFYAFNYDSYYEAVVASNADNLLSYQGELYLLGPISVAASFDMMNTLDYSFVTFIFDFFRSIMGLNFLVKDFDIESSSVMFNKFVSSGQATNGILLPISCHGAMFFSCIFGPALICFFYRIALYLEKLMYKSRYLFVQFFSAYVFIRFSTCLVSSNTNTLLTMGSLVFIFVVPIYLFQKMLER